MCQIIMLYTVLYVNYNKTGRKRMEEGGNVANQQWPWAPQQQGGQWAVSSQRVSGDLRPQNCAPGLRN